MLQMRRFYPGLKEATMKKLKRSITLIEMIIVMILIATITGAVAYNYNQSLNKGRVFKAKETVSRVETILSTYHAESDKDGNQIANDWREIVKESPLAPKDIKNITKDPWGKDYRVNYIDEEFIVTSEGLNTYEAKSRTR